jgi:hypothetical protein
MAATTAGNIVNNVKLVLQEITASGTRWANEELIGWLNEFYQAVVQLRPDAFSVNEYLTLIAGTKQTIPSSGLRLLDVIRNQSGTAIIVTTRRALDSTRRTWHSDDQSAVIEQFVYDELDPTHFYVYPPATTDASVEILYSAVPTPHDASQGLSVVGPQVFKLSDAYAPVATDYILYRAYSKDAEHAANLQRAQMHYQSYMQQMGGKAQTDAQASPSAFDSSANPQRARA